MEKWTNYTNGTQQNQLLFHTGDNFAFIFKKRYICFEIRVIESRGVTERKIFYPLVPSPPDCNVQCWNTEGRKKERRKGKMHMPLSVIVIEKNTSIYLNTEIHQRHGYFLKWFFLVKLKFLKPQCIQIICLCRSIPGLKKKKWFSKFSL